MNPFETLALALLAGTVGLGVAQAGGEHGGGHADTNGTAGDPAAVTREIVVELGDNYYDPEIIAVAGGETVRFRLSNTGAFVHEFNIGTPDMHVQHQAEMVMMMEHGVLEPDRIHRDRMMMDMGGGKTMAHDDPNSVLLEPGEEAEIVWQFPQSGRLEFACNVPGHYDSGMVGSFDLGSGS